MLQGIFPVIPILFTQDNQLDLTVQRRVIRFALDSVRDETLGNVDKGVVG